jgi:hypothetical protein
MYAANLPSQYAANLPSEYAANLPSGRMSPPTERDVTQTTPLLPALAPQLWDGASNRAGRSAAAHPTPRLPTSPHRVDGSRLAGVLPPTLTQPANVTRTVAPSWAATRVDVGASDNSPSILDFMSLYDICVAASHAARVSVCQSTGNQDVTLFCRFPTPTTAVNVRKRRRRHQRCPSATTAACPPPTTTASTACDLPSTSVEQPAEPDPNVEREPSAELPPPSSPPAKRTRKRRCEA